MLSGLSVFLPLSAVILCILKILNKPISHKLLPKRSVTLLYNIYERALNNNHNISYRFRDDVVHLY